MTMKREELYYRLALKEVHGIGPIKYKKLIENFGNAKDVFQTKNKKLLRYSGLSEANHQTLQSFTDFDRIEKELLFLEKYQYTTLHFDQDIYPNTLKNCADSPPLLFFAGQKFPANKKFISIIGTRSNSEYGKKICEELILQLKPYNVCVVSGLAFGIDILAHSNCIKQQIPTLGVMASGLDLIYPYEHTKVAKEMQTQGGLLTEYFSETIPDKSNFPSRNRIVAGMSEATIVIETSQKGGSIITAELAFSYNRDVFCFPGRIYDDKSQGCLQLIKSLKGQLVTSAEDIVQSLGWKQDKSNKKIQASLFIELNEHEQLLYDLLLAKGPLHIDQLTQQATMSYSFIASSLLSLEMQGLIQIEPGKIVKPL